MGKVKSIKFNFIMNILLTMSSIIFPIITFPYVSRVLGPVGTGKVSFVTSIISYFAMFAQLGIPTYGIRECAKVRDDKDTLSKTVHEILFINIVAVTITYVVLIGAIIAVPRFQEDRILFLVIGATIGLNAIGVEWLYKGLEQYTYITLRSIVFKFIALAMMLLLVVESDDYIIYGLTTIVASGLSNVLNFINVHRFVKFKKYDNYEIRKHLKPIFVFFAMSVATTLYTNFDTVMIGFMKSDIDVGYYNAAVKIKLLLVSLITALGAVLLPRMSYYIEQGLRDEYKRAVSKAISFVLLASIPMMGYCILYASEFIWLLAGAEYTDAIMPMQIIMPTLVLIGLSNLFAYQYFVPHGKEKSVLSAEVIGAVVNLVCNFVLIPKLSIVGAAISNVLAESVVLLWLIIQGRHFFKEIIDWKNFIKIVIANVFAFSLVQLVPDLNMENASLEWISFVRLAVSAIIYFGVYLVSTVVLKEKFVVDFMIQIMKRKNNF